MFRWGPVCPAVPVVLLTLAGTPVAAQQPRIRPSQRATVTQRIGFTEVTILWSRPAARGRTPFPDVVRWGRVWAAGADTATRITFEHDVLLAGHEVAAGTYSVWLIPVETGPWTFILSRATPVWHLPYPGEAEDALRFEAHAETGPHMESLAWYFPMVDGDSAEVRMHWGETMVPVRLVAPWRP